MSNRFGRTYPHSELGDKIRAARKKRCLSQTVVATRVGLSLRHYIRIENGEIRPSAEVLNRVAGELGDNELAREAAQAEADDPHRSGLTLEQLLVLRIEEVARGAALNVLAEGWQDGIPGHRWTDGPTRPVLPRSGYAGRSRPASSRLVNQ